MSPGWWVLLAAVLVTAVLGLAHRARQGGIRPPKGGGASVLDLPAELRERLDGEARVTLLQLSTTFCAPCRHTRVLLDDLARRTDGLRHVEVDLAHHPEWSTTLRVHTTPTTLVLDSGGEELFRIGGVPRRDALAEALRPLLA
ncbi:TlpA family protein disulfide reductase [Saccharopolyspora sp. CA-218241]|uniref:TlpA family protein disulfide reductase n=1 Tax=Saccharopolyspora sp. CA-218241 TaxID=3240027 RepID=UPI003D98BA44